MKIAMFTNTYLPHVGGVAKSVSSLEASCRRQGHEVRVVAPELEGAEASPNVLRVPAIQHFNGSDFAVRLPVPNVIRDYMEDFQPDVIHSHHPFLLGDAALREASKMRVPIVFTHHTLYERYTHYVPLDSAALKRAAIQLATEYCNLCDLVIAPSESIAELLQARKVRTPVAVVPTGIDVSQFAAGCGERFRKSHRIPDRAKVIGHVGRLAKEKNLSFLAESVLGCLRKEPEAVFLLVGEGEMHQEILRIFTDLTKHGRVIHPGMLSGGELVDAYAAIDCFVFTSQTETQGMVLAEAMAAGKPVVALDGPGVREIVSDGQNGILLSSNTGEEEFSDAILRVIREPERLEAYAERARGVAESYDIERCVDRMLACYQGLIERYQRKGGDPLSRWDRVLKGIEIEWELFSAKMSAAAAMVEPQATEARLD